MLPHAPALTVSGILAACLGSVGSAQPADRDYPPTVLIGVPQIGYNVHLSPFPGALHACLEYLGDPQDYAYLMGITGASFRRVWSRDDGGNVDLMYLTPEPHRRAFEALGYSYHEVQRNETAMITAIRKSIDRETPVIAFGLIGPPEAGLVTGYDQEGKTLYGWSYFQDRAQPGYYQIDDWFGEMAEGLPFGLIVVGGKEEKRPSPRAVLTASLEWAIDLARRSKRAGLPNHICGLAAYDAWADSLEVDSDYPLGDRKTMETRAMVHCDQVVMLHGRALAATFLRRMARDVPDVAEQLNTAAGLYEAAGNESGKVWHWGHWQQPAALKGMADAATRREFAKHIRIARGAEKQGVASMEAALAVLRGATEHDPSRPVLTRLELQWSKLVNYPPECRPNIECMPAPGVLRALVEFLGEDFGFSTNKGGATTWRTNEAFPLFMGVGGDAFEFVWIKKADAPQDAECPCLGNIRERFAAALAVAGFDCEVVLRKVGSTGPNATPFDRTRLRQRLVESLTVKGWPAILMDVPAPGHALIATGYSQGGSALIGWSVEGGDDRGIRFRPERKREFDKWFEQASAVVLLTAKHTRIPERRAYRDALERGVAFLRVREAADFHAGPATFEAWAGQLDDDTLDQDDSATEKRRNQILDPMIWDLATRRHYGNIFLGKAAELFPKAATELQAAATCFRAEHDMMWEINKTGGGKWPGSKLPRLKEPQIRRRVAEIILKSRDKDLEAAGHIEKALAKLD
ncbi:MAG: hypothetical protein HN742_19350 [Lentisphaerae bacterium]|jgi:hypothetical protein|nr:hypothetical protein [Lentisphaerota bacterium]MBT4821105.1 hypothetical protein [Lentisphaerota bacterium]MBT5611806.1 hypothetical protein [Lentisphaerota bacterium]MBT7053485.1 hypothetical protein [Lentisphaerota bacterium]MBT7844045.1 hypothetical protein [Lentisphaerota bacterium]